MGMSKCYVSYALSVYKWHYWVLTVLRVCVSTKYVND